MPNSNITISAVSGEASGIRVSGGFVLAGPENGLTVIPASTPLTALNYFDGKFLRAADLEVEQDYLRSLVRASNQAGGYGIAHGFDLTSPGDGSLLIGAGLAINADGEVLLLPTPATTSLDDLIAKSAGIPALSITPAGSGTFGDCVKVSQAPPSTVASPQDLFLITIAPAEALCGQEDVYGTLCEEACITSTQRPYKVEGIVVRARPLPLLVPLPTFTVIPLTATHLRSQVASAYFESERRRVASLISKAGLALATWCHGAPGESGAEVPIAVVARGGSGIAFIDEWIGRRERIETNPRRYWHWRMAMRPWDVYLAQILQFQCQLRDSLSSPTGSGGDPCSSSRALVGEAADTLSTFRDYYAQVSQKLATIQADTLPGGLSLLRSVAGKFVAAKAGFAAPVTSRILINNGIIELPSAGYLPVVPGNTPTVNQQIPPLMGEGVDLRYCIVRPDFVAHALEEAQHMERISLIQGIEHTDQKQQVDILVPNGEIVHIDPKSPGTGFEALVQIAPVESNARIAAYEQYAVAGPATLNFQGAARLETLATGGAAGYLAAAMHTTVAKRITDMVAILPTLAQNATVNTVNNFKILSANNEEAPAIGLSSNTALYSNLSGLAADAVRYTTISQANSTPAFIKMVNANAGTFTVKGMPQRLAVLWLAADCAQDPFKLEVGDSTAVNLRFVLSSPSEKLSLTDVELRGELRIEQPARKNGGTETVSGLLAALATIETTREGSDPAKVVARPKLPVTLSRTGDELTLNIGTTGPIQLVARTQWAGSPLKTVTKLEYRVNAAGATANASLASIRLSENADVLSAGNASHTAALSALEVLGASLADPSFADTEARLLFPPPPPPQEQLQVRATLDWVLFQRRRTKTCSDVKQVVVSAPRRYEVYELLVENADRAAAVRKILLAGDTAAVSSLGLRPVALTEFDATTATLLTPVADVIVDWKNAGAGDILLYAAVASSGAAAGDGQPLSLARLGRIENAVASLSPPAPNISAEMLPAVPPSLGIPGTDGVMILLTLKTIKTMCNSVYRASAPMDQIAATIGKDGIEGAIKTGQLLLLGDAIFEEGTAKPTGVGTTAVATKWAATGGTPASAASFAQKDNTAATEAVRQQQGQAILQALGLTTTSDKIPYGEYDGPSGSDCPTATIVVPVPRNALLLPWRGSTEVGAKRNFPNPIVQVAIQFNTDGTLVAPLTAAQVKTLKTAGAPFVQVELETRESVPDPVAPERLKLIVAELQAKKLLSPTLPAQGPPVTVPTADHPQLVAGTDDLIFLRIG